MTDLALFCMRQINSVIDSCNNYATTTASLLPVHQSCWQSTYDIASSGISPSVRLSYDTASSGISPSVRLSYDIASSGISPFVCLKNNYQQLMQLAMNLLW